MLHGHSVAGTVLSMAPERRSGSAQRLIFCHSVAGDLAPLLAGFFDTRVGGKLKSASYGATVGALGILPASLLFLSDAEAELDAAAGWLQTMQLGRAEVGTIASVRHATA